MLQTRKFPKQLQLSSFEKEVFTESYETQSLIPVFSRSKKDAEYFIHKILDFTGSRVWFELWESYGISRPIDSDFFKILSNKNSSLSVYSASQIAGAMANRLFASSLTAQRNHRCSQTCLNNDSDCPFSGDLDFTLQNIMDFYSEGEKKGFHSDLIFQRGIDHLQTFDSFDDRDYLDDEHLMLELLTDFNSYFRAAAELIRSRKSKVKSIRGTMIDSVGQCSLYFNLYLHEDNIVMDLREFFPLIREGSESLVRELNGESIGSKGERFRILGALVNALISANVSVLTFSDLFHRRNKDSLEFDLTKTGRAVSREIKEKLWT